MTLVLFTASPNRDGLTAACGRAAKAGAESGGASVVHIDLNRYALSRCSVCGDGWGTCRDQHFCQVDDDFQGLHALIQDAEGFILVTPVYWGEMSEAAKAFFDRLRRCEAVRGKESLFFGKPCAGVAAAGGSGGGTVTCIASMQHLFTHMGGRIFDLIPITQKNRQYALEAIQNCGEALVRVT